MDSKDYYGDVLFWLFRAKDVDLTPYLTTRLVDDFASHIRLYRRALDRVIKHRKDGKHLDNLISITVVWAWQHCRINPSRFLVECRKSWLNRGNVVSVLYFTFFAFLSCLLICVFSSTVLFVSLSHVIGCKDNLWNDPDCVCRGVKLYPQLFFTVACHSVLIQSGPKINNSQQVVGSLTILVCRQPTRPTQPSTLCGMISCCIWDGWTFV